MLVTAWVSQEGAAAREAEWREEEECRQEGRRGQRAWKERISLCTEAHRQPELWAMDPLLEQSGSGLLHLQGSSVSHHPDSLPVSLHPLGLMAVALPWVAGST